MTISDKKLVCKKLLETLVKVRGPLVPLVNHSAPCGGRWEEEEELCYETSAVFIRFLCVTILVLYGTARIRSVICYC